MQGVLFFFLVDGFLSSIQYFKHLLVDLCPYSLSLSLSLKILLRGHCRYMTYPKDWLTSTLYGIATVTYMLSHNYS